MGEDEGMPDVRAYLPLVLGLSPAPSYICIPVTPRLSRVCSRLVLLPELRSRATRLSRP